MLDPLENDPFNIPDYEHIEDERFPPLPPPHSPGQGGDEAEVDPFANGEEEEGEISKLAEVPAAKKRGVKRPQPKLDSQRLISERGLPALRTLFDNVHLKGKGHEAEDLRVLMQKMENWAHRLYPKLQFDDFIDKVEKLGGKKDVQTCLKRIRLDMPLTHEDFISKDDEETAPREERVLEDPDPFGDGGFPDEPLTLVHSTPAPPSAAPSLTEEQRRRIELNKQLALERRLARTQQHTGPSSSQPVSSTLSADEPSSSSSSSQLLSQLKDQEEDQDQDVEGEDVDLDQSSGAAEQLKDTAPRKDPLLSPDMPPCEKGESSRQAVSQLSNGSEDSD